MRYIIRYRLKGFGKDPHFIHNVIRYNIKENIDSIEIEYDKEVLQYIFFGKKVIIHIKRIFMKNALSEIGIRESITEKAKESELIK